MEQNVDKEENRTKDWAAGHANILEGGSREGEFMKQDRQNSCWGNRKKEKKKTE